MSVLGLKLPIIYIFNIEINILAQVFGLIALIFAVIAYQKKNKINFLIFCNISFLFTMLECLILGAITGFIKPFTGVIRNIVCMLYLKKGKQIPKYYNIVFVLLMVVPSLFFVNNLTDVLPIVTSIISTLVTIQGGILILKSGGLVVQVIMVIYNFLIGAYIGVIRQSIILVSVICSLIVMFKKRKDNTKNI